MYITIASRVPALLLIILFFTACADRNDENGNLSNVVEINAVKEQNIQLVTNDTESRVDVFVDGEHFTSYLYSPDFKKPVLYPLITARGTIVTRGYPLEPRPDERDDHPHHLGLWFNYGDVNGLDFWNNSDNIPAEKIEQYGTVLHREINSIKSGNKLGELTVTLEWVDHEGKVLLVENTTFLFQAQENMRVIDRITTLTALDDEVSLKDNKEGMLGIRMARELEHQDEHEAATGMYRSSEGLEGVDVWGTRGKWMKLSGEIDEEKITVAIMDHPENVGYPTYWHARGYGLFAANPLGQKSLSGGKEELNFSLASGDSTTFKHRIIIVSGQHATDEQTDQAWEEFIQ